MKYSNTALRELSARYKHVLLKCALLNATILMGVALATPAFAAANGVYYPQTDEAANLGTVQYENHNTNPSTSNWDSTVLLVSNRTVTVGENSSFKNNTAGVGGAIAITTKPGSKVQIGAGSIFENNTSFYDGGAIGNYGGAIISNDVTFLNNKAQTHAAEDSSQIGGGAISLGAFSNTLITNNLFQGNESGYNGGAIGTRDGYNKNNLSEGEYNISSSKFISNSANGYMDGDKQIAGNGGAIYNTFYKTAAVSDSEFTGNKAAADGGAIYNSATTDKFGKFGDITLTNNIFANNEAGVNGGALFNGGKATVAGTTSFTGNTAGMFGGAIYNDVNGVLDIQDNVTFDSNKAGYQGGGIYSMGDVTIGDNATFTSNEALAIGAIANVQGDTTKPQPTLTIGDNAKFISNKATDADGTAGAIYTQNGVTKIGTNAAFDGNSAAYAGGALYNETTAGAQNGSTLTIGDNAQFTNNTSGSGAAIYNYAAGSADTVLNIGQNTLFSNNTATTANGRPGNGGAIGLFGGTANIGAGTSFTNNTAAGLGGAIMMGNYGYDALLNLNTESGKDIVFSGNTDSSGANDIYMADGSLININGNGIARLEGGIAMDSGAQSAVLNVNDSATLDLGSSTINATNVTFAAGSTLKAMLLMDAPVITADTLVTNNATLDLSVGTGVKEGTYTFASTENEMTDDFVLADSIKDNVLFDITSGTDKGTITVAKKDEAVIKDALTSTGATDTQAAAISAMTEAAPVDAHAQTIANAITAAAQSGDTVTAAALASSVNPAETPVVQQHSVATTNQIVSVASDRMSAQSEGLSGGSMADFTYGPWIQGIYNKTHNSQGVGFDGYSQGFAAGVDVGLTDSVMLGAGYGYTATDIKDQGRKTQVYSDNFFLYGKYQPNAWYVQGVLNYGTADYKEKALGLIGKYSVDTYAGQALVGYQKGLFDTFGGVRYAYINPDDYSNGLTEVHQKNAQVGTAIIGTKISKEFKRSGVTFKPEFRIAGTYDFKSDNSASFVNVVGGTTSYMVDGKRLHRAALETGVGLKASIKNLDVILSYDANLRSEQTSQTGSVKLQYNF